jgi:hypothetical protein
MELSTSAIASFVETLLKWARAHPLRVGLASHAVTSAIFLWYLSEGKPSALLYKLAFRAAMSAVPKSIVDKETEAIRAKIEHSVVGDPKPGERRLLALPAEGMSKADVVAALDAAAAADRKKWASGKVRGGLPADLHSRPRSPRDVD